MLSILRFSVNGVHATAYLPSVPRSGNSLHEASPTEPAPEQKWLQQRMPIAQHLGNWVFTLILFQNNFLEGWIVNVTVQPCMESPFSLIQFVT